LFERKSSFFCFSIHFPLRFHHFLFICHCLHLDVATWSSFHFLALEYLQHHLSLCDHLPRHYWTSSSSFSFLSLSMSLMMNWKVKVDLIVRLSLNCWHLVPLIVTWGWCLKLQQQGVANSLSSWRVSVHNAKLELLKLVHTGLDCLHIGCHSS
jgi:hypothetical protein